MRTLLRKAHRRFLRARNTGLHHRRDSFTVQCEGRQPTPHYTKQNEADTRTILSTNVEILDESGERRRESNETYKPSGVWPSGNNMAHGGKFPLLRCQRKEETKPHPPTVSSSSLKEFKESYVVVLGVWKAFDVA